MNRAVTVHPVETWSGRAADTVVLDFDDRHRRRVTMTGVNGVSFLLDLAEAVMLRGGDALELDDGRLIEVVSAPEALIEIRGRTPVDLLRLAWHIGNRHLPAQLMPRAIRIREDHVIEEMLRGLGALVVAIEAPFDPEGGAYARGGHADPGDGVSGHDHHDHHRDHVGHSHAGHDHSHDHEGPAHKHEP